VADAPGRPIGCHRPNWTRAHLSYAIQWFSFAAIGTIGWLALIRRPRRTRPEEPSEAGDLVTPGESGSDVA
jgi:cytochrome oxidase assembly protein ShyY1